PLCCTVLALTLVLSIVLMLRTGKHVQKNSHRQRAAAAAVGSKSKKR
ncbi:hypothetical protein HJV71_16475, partial [Eubacterium callanderi]|nr:hypothetical protein [Eubacterium callanderi]